MSTKISTGLDVGKKMQTSADKAGDTEMVTCRIFLKNIRVNRETADEVGGLPIGCSGRLFDELGVPLARLEQKFPKRAMLFDGKIQHKKDSGATVAELKLTKAAIGEIKLSTDAPDADGGPTFSLSFVVVWKAGGDEVDDVKFLLGRKCFGEFTLKNEAQQESLALQPANSSKAESAAGHRAKLDRKRRAAGEKEKDNDEQPVMAAAPAAPFTKSEIDGEEFLMKAFEFVLRTERASTAAVQQEYRIGYNRAARILETLEKYRVVGPMQPNAKRDVFKTGPWLAVVAAPADKAAPTLKPQHRGSSLDDIEREATELAKKHPRREQPPAYPRGRH